MKNKSKKILMCALIISSLIINSSVVYAESTSDNEFLSKTISSSVAVNNLESDKIEYSLPIKKYSRVFYDEPFPQYLCIATEKGSDISAICSGTVLKADDKIHHILGRYIEILGDDGYIYQYCHMDTVGVLENDTIKAGDKIGTVGATGMAFIGIMQKDRNFPDFSVESYLNEKLGMDITITHK